MKIKDLLKTLFISKFHSIFRNLSTTEMKMAHATPITAINALLVMIPSAIFLNIKSSAGEFDKIFYAVQILELAVGLVQLTLLSLDFRDGLVMSGRLKAPNSITNHHTKTQVRF